MALLEVRDLHKTYVTGKVETPALRGLDLSVAQGEFTAVVGPSGSGKTTLMNLIGGLDVPDSGTIDLNGERITGMGRKQLSDTRLKHLGFVFQAYNLIPVLTALENVEYVMLLQGVSKRDRRQRSEAVLESLGLADMTHKRPNEMSGGQQQRVAVARAIVSEPKLVLADEPTANLDSETSCRLLDLMRGMNTQKHITFIFSTHDRVVMERARRIVTIKDGMIADDNNKGEAPHHEG